jgi:nodulation protein F
MWDSKFEDLLRPHLPFLAAGEQLEFSAPLRDYGLDSLAAVGLLSTLESAYQVRFENEALTLETFETAGVLWQTLSAIAS